MPRMLTHTSLAYDSNIASSIIRACGKGRQQFGATSATWTSNMMVCSGPSTSNLKVWQNPITYGQALYLTV